MPEQETQSEAISKWINKSEQEKILSNSMHGSPELKYDEKIHYLGEFKERVIRFLTKKQIEEHSIYPEIIDALKDKRSVKMIINGSIASYFSGKYENLARELGKPCKVISNPKFKGEVGLVIVGDDAVDIEEINVIDRETRLSKLGLPKALINAAGKKICSHCLEKVIYADPNEAINYKKLTRLDRFLGDSCEACKNKR